MRLQSYILNESLSIDNIIKTLQKDCRYYIEAIKTLIGATPMYRGYKSNDVFLKIIPRMNRKPLNMPLHIHKYIDEWFYKKFGWRTRSEGVFTNSLSYLLSLYGNPYLFFPAGNKLKFVYSPIISDLLVDISIAFSNNYNTLKVEDIGNIDLNNSDHKRLLDDLLESAFYIQNKNLQGIFSGKEIIWKCSYYYLVEEDYVKKSCGIYEFMKRIKDL